MMIWNSSIRIEVTSKDEHAQDKGFELREERRGNSRMV